VIRGFFAPAAGQPAPMVRVGVFLPTHEGRFGVVHFLIDTGATSTCLHPRDAMFALGLDPVELADPERWPDRSYSRGIGGSVEYYRLPAQYLFIHDDMRPELIHSSIFIAQLRAENQGLPSLLGRDLLQHFPLRLDMAAREITLG
jgi:hypothetical protein